MVAIQPNPSTIAALGVSETRRFFCSLRELLTWCWLTQQVPRNNLFTRFVKYSFMYFLLLASGFLPRPFLIRVFTLHIPLYIGDYTLVHSGSWEALFYPYRNPLWTEPVLRKGLIHPKSSMCGIFTYMYHNIFRQMQATIPYKPPPRYQNLDLRLGLKVPRVCLSTPNWGCFVSRAYGHEKIPRQHNFSHPIHPSLQVDCKTTP